MKKSTGMSYQISRHIILLWMVCYTVDSAEEQPVVEERHACLYHGHLTLTCPKDYIVVIRHAQYFKSKSRGCSPDEVSLCEGKKFPDPDMLKGILSILKDCRMESVTRDHIDLCLTLDSCTIKLKDPVAVNPCTGYRGDPFLKVVYECQPYMMISHKQNVKRMCDFTPPVWSGSLLYLWSPNFPEYNQQDDCGCSIHVNTGIKLEIIIPHFEPPSEERDAVDAEGCSQVIHVQSGYNRKTICSVSADHFNRLDVDVNNNVYMQFRNPNKHHVRFWIIMQVHHDFNFTVSCQRNFKMPSLPTTLDPPTTTTKPTSSGEISSSNFISHWPIITGVVTVICVILVISVALLLFCRRQHKNKTSKKRDTSKVDGFTYQNSVFMTHNQVGGPPSNYSGSNHSSQHTAVSIEIVSSQVPSTINIRSSTSSPVTVNPVVQDHDVKDIPKAVVDRLGFQSETTMKPSRMSKSTVGDVYKSHMKETPKENKPSPQNSMTDLSVKDLAKLMEHQLQGK